MPAVHLEFPAFVQITQHAKKRHYRVHPLFDPSLHGLGRTFDKAVRACAEDVRRTFRGWVSDRDSVERLQWLALCPDYRVDTPELVLGRGAQTLHDAVTVVTFTVGAHRYGCLPRFDSAVFAAPAGLRWSAYLEYVQTAVDAQLRARRKEAAPARLDPTVFAKAKGDFVTNVRATVQIKRGSFDFDTSLGDWFFSRMPGHREFSGAAELPKVAADLTHAFPDELKRALVADDRLGPLLRVLDSREPPPTVLLGPSGSGRTTLLHEAIATRLETVEGALDKAPKTWLLDPTRITAGMSIIGQWQRRADAIFTWLVERRKKTYHLDGPDALYVDNPVALTRMGRSAGSDLALSAVLRPWLEARRFPVILEATPEEWGRIEEEDRSFADLFQVLRVDAPPRERALRIVLRQRARIERTQEVELTRDGVARAVELAERYPSHKVLPGSVLDRLERLALRLPRSTIDRDVVDEAFLKASGLRLEIVDRDKPLGAAELRADLAKGLIGQEAALDALTAAIQQLRAGVTDPGRPMGSLLLVGPTGVGKTEAAKVLCKALYTEPEHLVRFDMNEYVDAGAASRLIGGLAHPEGQLTSRIRHQPFCVLLLDEIEKAHPSVHDLLLQLLDEGRLTDARGRLVRFTQCVVVLTSNVGARKAAHSMGFDGGEQKLEQTYRAAIGQAFRPEFVNRIDRIVVFRPLGPADIRQVAELQLARLLQRDGFLRRTTLLRVSEAAMDAIATSGFDARMGARSMKRALESQIVSLVADAVVSLPPEQPVVLSADVDDDGLALDARPLPFVPTSDATSLSEQAEDVEQPALVAFETRVLTELIAHLDRHVDPDSALVASAGPGGVEVATGEERVLRSAAHEMLEELHPTPGERKLPEVRPGAVRSRARPYSRGRHRWNQHPRFWDRLAHARIRDYLHSCLQERAVHGERWVDTGLERLAQLHYGVQFVGRDGPAGARVILRTLTGGAGDLAALVAAYRRLRTDEHAPGVLDRDRPLQWLAGGQTVALPGAGMYELLASERGVHLLYPELGPPVAVQVTVVPWVDGDKTIPPPDLPEAVVRVYCPPGTAGELGSVADARSGQVVPWDAFDHRCLSAWLYMALPEALRLALPGGP